MGQIDDQISEATEQTNIQKTVVITGGNAGIGKESAVAIAAMGAMVIFT